MFKFLDRLWQPKEPEMRMAQLKQARLDLMRVQADREYCQAMEAMLQARIQRLNKHESMT